jgi:hypothetical protein
MLIVYGVLDVPMYISRVERERTVWLDRRKRGQRDGREDEREVRKEKILSLGQASL